MKKFVTDNLRLSITYIIEIGELINQISDFSGKGLERKFEDYYTKVLSGDSYIYYFKNGLSELLQNEECVLIRKSFISEIKAILKKHAERDLIWFPISPVRGKHFTSIKYFDELSTKLPKPDMLLEDTRKALITYNPNIPETIPPIISAFKSLQKLINYEITMFLFEKELEIDEQSQDNTNITQLEKDCYIKAWIKQKVKPKDWMRFEGIIIQDELASRKVAKEIQEKVFKHQVRLFYDIASEHYSKKYLNIFNQIDNLDHKYEFANTDFSLISDMINGDINDIKKQLIQDCFDVVDIPKVASQIVQIVRRNFQYKHFDIHHNENVLKAFALYKYKKHLNNYLQHSASHQTLFDKNDIETFKPTFRYIHFDKYPDKITRLFIALKESNSISPDTEKKVFEALFSGYALKQQVVWIGSLATLKTLISALTKNNAPLVHTATYNKWNIAASCFIKPLEEPINPKSLRTARRSKKTIEFSKIVKLLT